MDDQNLDEIPLSKWQKLQYSLQGMTSNVKFTFLLVTQQGRFTISIEQDK